MASLDVTGAGSAAKAGLPSHLELACALLCCLRISLQRARKHVSHPHKIAMYMSWIPSHLMPQHGSCVATEQVCQSA